MSLNSGHCESCLWSLWLLDPCPTTVPCIHIPLSSICIATADHLEREKDIFVSIYIFPYFWLACLLIQYDYSYHYQTV